jgi:hypothetical protein
VGWSCVPNQVVCLNKGHRDQRAVAFKGVIDISLTHHVEYFAISPVKVPEVHIGKVKLQEVGCVAADGVHCASQNEN